MRIPLTVLTLAGLLSACGDSSDGLGFSANEAVGYAAAAQMVSGCYEERTVVTDLYAPDMPDYHYDAMMAQLEKQNERSRRLCFGKGDQVRMFKQMIDQTKKGKCAGSELTFSGNSFRGDFTCEDSQGKTFDMQMDGEVAERSMRMDLVLSGELFGMGDASRTSTTTWTCVEQCGTY